MTGVSNLGNLMAQQFVLKAMRDQVDDTQRQISTGKISTSMAGLGSQGASSAIYFRNRQNVLDQYIGNINGAQTKLTVLDKAMGQITDDTRNVLSTLRSQLQDTVPQATIIADAAKTALSDIIAKLNEQVNGQYVFAGDDLHNAPFANQATLDANMSALVSGWMTGGTTAAAVVTDAQTQTGTALGYSATGLTAGRVSFMADDNTNIDYTQMASQSGYADILRGLSVIANLPQPTTAAEQSNYWEIVNGAISLLDSGATQVDTYQGLLGNKAKLVDDLLAQHKDMQGTFETFVGSIEDVDMAKVSTDFQALQSQMQMSYSVISMLKDLNLVNFL